MSGLLVDTNVVSELHRARPSSSVLAFMARTPIESLFLSEVVIAEIRYGIEIVSGAERRRGLAGWLEEIVRPMFAGRILPLTENILLRWRVMLQLCRTRGRRIGEPDLLLAATAAQHGLAVASRDIAPFRQVGIDVVDPWTAA